MTDGFDLTTDEQRENVREFIEEHGSEGFFVLYFRQLFYRFVKQELKSATDDIESVGEQLYFSDSGDTLLEQYREQLLATCEERARELVTELKNDDDLGNVIRSGDLDAFAEHDDAFRAAVHRQFQAWQDEGIALLEESEAESEGDE